MSNKTIPKPGTLPEKPMLSVCMIVRDEEKMLPRCLKSVQGVADELIVVDTGSKDNTISVARDFGAKVYCFDWNDDFAAARNESLKYAKGDWIFQIDADEELLQSTTSPLKKAMLNPWCLVYVITCDNGATSRSERFVKVGRLFRNHPLVQYSRPYHEMVSSSAYELIAQEPQWQLLDEPRIIIRHYGYELYEMQSRKKHERGIRIMESYLRENHTDVYMLTKLGESYNSIGQYDEAIDMFEKSIAINPHITDTHNNLGMAYYAKGFIDKAISEYIEAIAIEADFAEAHYNLGLVYGTKGIVDKEISEYKKALAINPNLAEARINLSHAIKTGVRRTKKIARNEPCPCGSGKKYKKCCGANV